MASSSQDVEILVHVTAPSRSCDDATYRQLAQAYLDFQPKQRATLPSLQLSHESSRVSLSKQPREAQPGTHLNQDDSFSAPSPFPTLQSQDLSFQSALDNRFSPVLAVTRPSVSQNPKAPSSLAGDDPSQSSWAPPSSEISDSYPMPDADLVLVSPTRVLQRYMSRPTALPRSPPKRDRSTSEDSQVSKEVGSSPGFLVASSLPLPPANVPDQAQECASLQQAPITVIPLTPFCSQNLARSEQTTDGAYDELVINETTHIQSSLTTFPSQASSFRAESEPPPSKRLKTTQDLISEPASLVRSSSDTCQPRRRLVHSRLDHSQEILSPSPPVGVVDIKPADLVSKKLSKLATDLSSRYRPVTQRELEPFERGHWLLDCTGWNSKTRVETWIFLTNYVGSGLAGWGVWCRRDPSHAWVRLYCWGHIAKHTYLLLYLASGRQLKATGATWIGADGEVALRVPPHDRQA
ncbi:hypothetical protein HJFPF1_01559 [Paramyrothecium foliicola]|nr:hypothetical protein HJFPF1_01559 [Paramyrothecium foliicola]